MPRKIYKPEEIIAKLRQVEVLTSQGKSAVDAIRSIGVTDATYYRWRQEYGGLKVDQVKRLKELEAENAWPDDAQALEIARPADNAGILSRESNFVDVVCTA